jgi:hypothetical protein
MDFRSASIIVTLLIGHGGPGCQAFAQYYPYVYPVPPGPPHGSRPPIDADQDLRDAATPNRLIYSAFDLLYLDGYDLRGTPLIERKRALQELLAKSPPKIVYVEHFEMDDGEAGRESCASLQEESPPSRPSRCTVTMTRPSRR